jgi:hypothetical protein
MPTRTSHAEGDTGGMACGTDWTLWRALKTGKGTPEAPAINLPCPNYLNRDDISLYCSNSVDGTVMRLAK